jgi:hypothetical protein
MRHTILLDSSLTGSPYHTLRALLWNVRTLGFWWWLRCFVENVGRSVFELTRHALLKWHFVTQGPARVSIRAVTASSAAFCRARMAARVDLCLLARAAGLRARPGGPKPIE